MDDDFCLLPEDLSEYIEEHTSPVEALLSALDRDTHVNVLCPRMLSGAYQGKLLEMREDLRSGVPAIRSL